MPGIGNVLSQKTPNMIRSAAQNSRISLVFWLQVRSPCLAAGQFVRKNVHMYTSVSDEYLSSSSGLNNVYCVQRQGMTGSSLKYAESVLVSIHYSFLKCRRLALFHWLNMVRVAFASASYTSC